MLYENDLEYYVKEYSRISNNRKLTDSLHMATMMRSVLLSAQPRKVPSTAFRDWRKDVLSRITKKEDCHKVETVFEQRRRLQSEKRDTMTVFERRKLRKKGR